MSNCRSDAAIIAFRSAQKLPSPWTRWHSSDAVLRRVDSTDRGTGAWPRALQRALLVIAFAFTPTLGVAAELGQSKTVSGLTVYLGIMPAEIIRGHPKSHPEAQAHGGPSRGEHDHYVIVAIFDAGNGARIEDATVAARVSSLGLAGPRKPLELMRIADTITYGNYFDLPGRGAYRIDVEIEWPQGTTRLTFDYQH